MSKPVPKHLVHMYGSARAFKATKRKELKALAKAFDAVCTGSAYLPCGHIPILRIKKDLDLLMDACSEKNWGR